MGNWDKCPCLEERYLPRRSVRCCRSGQCEQLGGTRGSGNIDIWKLKLDGTGKDFTRITYFNDYEGGKASNPVISTDGRVMAFQVATTGDPAGVGYGILLFHLKP